MPLSTPNKRKLLHTREVTCQGFLRDDGLVEIEGHLVDTKPFDLPNKDRGGEIKAGEPLHGMSVRIALDDTMMIREAEATMDYTPYNYCQQVAPVFEKLVGIRIGTGWRAKIRERVGGAQGCTHLSELLPVMATTAFQTLVSVKRMKNGGEEGEQDHAEYVPHLINTCHTHAEDSPVVKEHWPKYYTGD